MIGASPRRKEDARLLAGAGRFVDDITRPGLLHLVVVRSQQAHARLTKVDTSQAVALPGVVAAWTAVDLPETARVVPRAHGGAPRGRPWSLPTLAADVVRHVGEPVAVVIATDPYRGADAVEAVRLAYEPLEPLATVEQSLASGARLHEGWPDNTAIAVRGAVGDVDAALPAAEVVVAARLRHPRLAGSAIEARGVIAWLEAETGRLAVASSTQNPYALRDVVAAALGLPAEEVRVVLPDVGGAFGPKGLVYPEDVLVALAARRLGRPVKWIESRREDLLATGHDREQVHEARLAFHRDGSIAGLDDRFVADLGAYPTEGDGLALNTVNHLPGPYRVPAYRGVGSGVVTSKAFNAAYRGAGRPEAVFVMERLMDLGARRLGLDPAELRRRNLVVPREMPYRPGLTYKDGRPIAYDPADFPASFERALREFGYESWRRRQRAQATGTRRLGVGLACYAQGTGLGPWEGATVRVDPSGTVYVLIGVSSQGQGHATTLAQIAAVELGARLDDVVVTAGDTSLFPYGMGTGGSRVMANAGPAVARTAREVRRRAAQVAAELLECAPDDVVIDNGRAHVAGVPASGVTLGRLAQAALRSRALRASGEPGLSSCTYFHPETVTWAFGTHAAAVEVDVETAEVRLLACAVLHDPGRAVNPVVVEGQLHGGATQGLAAGLMEEVVYDDRAQLLSATLMDYALPRADQVPSFTVALDEHPSAINDLGVKGVGESGAIPGAAAIANAVEDAVADLGVTIREVPVTASRLFALLEAGRSR
jgi:CO/xanthine dehydrogenase Mo-binding subunit